MVMERIFKSGQRNAMVSAPVSKDGVAVAEVQPLLRSQQWTVKVIPKARKALNSVVRRYRASVLRTLTGNRLAEPA